MPGCLREAREVGFSSAAVEPMPILAACAAVGTRKLVAITMVALRTSPSMLKANICEPRNLGSLRKRSGYLSPNSAQQAVGSQCPS